MVAFQAAAHAYDTDGVNGAEEALAGVQAFDRALEAAGGRARLANEIRFYERQAQPGPMVDGLLRASIAAGQLRDTVLPALVAGRRVEDLPEVEAALQALRLAATSPAYTDPDRRLSRYDPSEMRDSH